MQLDGRPWFGTKVSLVSPISSRLRCKLTLISLSGRVSLHLMIVGVGISRCGPIAASFAALAALAAAFFAFSAASLVLFQALVKNDILKNARNPNTSSMLWCAPPADSLPETLVWT